METQTQPASHAAAAPSTIPCHDPATLQSLGDAPVVRPPKCAIACAAPSARRRAGAQDLVCRAAPRARPAAREDPRRGASTGLVGLLVLSDTRDSSPGTRRSSPPSAWRRSR